MSDPWADDWGDDWTHPPQRTVPASELWKQANEVQKVTIADVAPSIAYKPAMTILKREAAPVSNAPSAVELSLAEKARQQALEKAAREQRYKEARERLFGSPSASPGPEGIKGRNGANGSSPAPGSMPERQARGPDADGRRGFSHRGRGRGVQS